MASCFTRQKGDRQGIWLWTSRDTVLWKSNASKMREFRSLFSQFFARNFAKKFEPNFMTFRWNKSNFSLNFHCLSDKSRYFARQDKKLCLTSNNSSVAFTQTPLCDRYIQLLMELTRNVSLFILFETVPQVEAYTLQIVRINHWRDKTRSYTVKGDTWYLQRLFKTSSLALSWDTALPTL